MKIKAVVVALACVAALVAETADADKLVRKSRERRIPDGWCPLVAEDVLIFQFKATGSSATLRLVADNRPGQRIDNVYVVEKRVFEENLVDDDECNRGKTFDPLSGNAVFVETFDSEANGWKLNGSSWQPGSSPQGDQAGGALYLDANGLGGVIVPGLKKGRTYVVGGWWYMEANPQGSVLTLKVDTRGQLGCGPEKAVTGDLEPFALEEE